MSLFMIGQFVHILADDLGVEVSQAALVSASDFGEQGHYSIRIVTDKQVMLVVVEPGEVRDLLVGEVPDSLKSRVRCMLAWNGEID